MLTIKEKEIMKRIAKLAILEEDLIKGEMSHYKQRTYRERPRDEMGRWLPDNHETSLKETEEFELISPRKIKIVRDKEKSQCYHVKDSGFTIEDLKSLLACIGVLAAFIFAAMT